ncbi:Nucleoside diphosphate kinase [Candidatus Paraburkholderia calva]|nr:Nucleoside diphosphate kinase [Candidatus Paraburkholderia calva]
MHIEQNDEFWRAATTLPAKRSLYSRDSFFLEGYYDVSVIWQHQLSSILPRVALVLFKSETIVGGRLGGAHELLSAQGFTAVAAERIRFTGGMFHDLWRYQFQRATADKIRLYTRWAAGTDGVVAAYIKTMCHPRRPASVDMKVFKGPAAVDRRKPEQLRSLMASPNSILNFVHASDEPADVLRELAVLIPADCRDRVLRAIAVSDLKAGQRELLALVREFASKPPHDLNVTKAGERLAAVCRAANAGDPRYFDAVMTREKPLVLREMERALGTHRAEIDPIDVIVFASEYVRRDLPLPGDLDDDCVPRWDAVDRDLG